MFRRRSHSALRLITAAAVLVMYLIAALGVLPAPSAVARWFGQVMGERLAWAIAHGVMPPEGVVFSDEEWVAAANVVRPGRATCLLCAASVRDAVRNGVALQAEGGGGGNERACASGLCCGDTAKKQESSRGVTWPGASMSALSCKGLAQMLSLMLPPVPAVGGSVAVLPAAVCVEIAAVREERLVTRVLDVDVPPPRLGC